MKEWKPKRTDRNNKEQEWKNKKAWSRAFHSDNKFKELAIARLEESDGNVWLYGNGEPSDHEVGIGILRSVGELGKVVCSMLSPEEAKLWQSRFIQAIKRGSDLYLVWPKTAVWLLAEPTHGVRRLATEEVLFPSPAHAVDNVVSCYHTFSNVSEEWDYTWHRIKVSAEEMAKKYACQASRVAVSAACWYNSRTTHGPYAARAEEERMSAIRCTVKDWSKTVSDATSYTALAEYLLGLLETAPVYAAETGRLESVSGYAASDLVWFNSLESDLMWLKTNSHEEKCGIYSREGYLEWHLKSHQLRGW